ncbi:hypothetical protein C5S53_15425 [Methanophagales archaeon]|nr:hypothetical protein C5S53_15425 [Methanophagales archaeon]
MGNIYVSEMLNIGGFYFVFASIVHDKASLYPFTAKTKTKVK